VGHGLAFAHSHGLVHRDVKPQNVLMNGDDQAKVTDFGIARSIDVDVSVTQTGTVLGTSAYIAPEQASGGDITPQTDVYSLGVVLYELLTAEVPFPGENFVAVAMKHLNDPVPDILERRPDVPMRLVAAMEHALEKDPARRFSSMREFASELRACLAELGTFDAERTFIAPRQVLRESAPHRARARRRRWPIFVVLALLGAAAVVAGVLELGGSKTNPRTTPPAATGTVLTVRGVGAYDPVGGDGEHDSEAPLATDRNGDTFWTTSSYHYGNGSLGKPGVGVVLDAGRPVQVHRIGIATDTPGFRASIRASNSPRGGFTAVTPTRTVGGQAQFAVHGPPRRYYLIWITKLGPGYDTAHVNEVSAT
jgi:hypothetical protein